MLKPSDNVNTIEPCTKTRLQDPLSAVTYWQAGAEPLVYKRGQHLRGVDAENAEQVQAEMVCCIPFMAMLLSHLL